MKLLQLQKTAAKARQDLGIAEGRAVSTRLIAKSAKATAEKSRIEYKRTRKAAKQAKKAAREAEVRAQEQARIFAKAQKHLAKASKKMGRGKPRQKAKPIRLAIKTRKSVVAKSARSAPATIKRTIAPIPVLRPSGESAAVPASSQGVLPTPSGSGSAI